MAEVFELQAELRNDIGTIESRRMRRTKNLMPAVIYGGHEAIQHLSFNHDQIVKATANEGFYSRILTINVAGKKQRAVVKAVQRHPFKPKVVHMDFLRISEKEKITMQIPLHFLNEDKALGVKKGGIVSHIETSVTISCLPGDLPEYIEVDLSQLDLDHSIHLSELNKPKGVDFVDLSHENDKPVVNIHLPRAAVEAGVTTEAAESETTAETEAEEKS